MRFARNGELIVGPNEYDDPVFKELAEINTAYNFFPPVPGMQFVIRGLNAKADQQVSTNTDAIVVIYEAEAADSTTEDKILFQEAMVRGDRSSLDSLNIIVNDGKFLNAKTTDDDIFMTIWGFYVKIL